MLCLVHKFKRRDCDCQLWLLLYCAIYAAWMGEERARAGHHRLHFFYLQCRWHYFVTIHGGNNLKNWKTEHYQKRSLHHGVCVLFIWDDNIHRCYKSSNLVYLRKHAFQIVPRGWECLYSSHLLQCCNKLLPRKQNQNHRHSGCYGRLGSDSWADLRHSPFFNRRIQIYVIFICSYLFFQRHLSFIRATRGTWPSYR